jgi:hypothetical protein
MALVDPDPMTASGARVMDTVVPVCFPSSDLGFGERVRAFVHSERWHLASAEGTALLQALLRESYPLASVVPHERLLVDDGHLVQVLDVFRDGVDPTVRPRR